MIKYKPGIENTPSNPPAPILVIIRSLSDYTKVEEKRLDYAKAEDRKELGKLTFWAICNHHSVETMLLSDVTPDVQEQR